MYSLLCIRGNKVFEIELQHLNLNLNPYKLLLLQTTTTLRFVGNVTSFYAKNSLIVKWSTMFCYYNKNAISVPVRAWFRVLSCSRNASTSVEASTENDNGGHCEENKHPIRKSIEIPFSRARVGAFFQSLPQLGNQFKEDVTLRRYLKRVLPSKVTGSGRSKCIQENKLQEGSTARIMILIHFYLRSVLAFSCVGVCVRLSMCPYINPELVCVIT